MYTQESNHSSAASYRNGILHVEQIPVTELAARFGTPLYVYSASTLQSRFRRVQTALDGVAPRVLVCYALKANANPVLGGMLASWGAGVDVVSGGEIFLARRMGFPGERIVFAGVGKTRKEMAEALQAGVRSLHVESAGEMDTLAEVAAELRVEAPVAVRVNPDVEAGTHPYITTGTHANKFGVAPDEALTLVRQAANSEWLRPVGLHAHIGSQLPRVQPVIEATKRLLELWDRLDAEGIRLSELDIGGGLGIRYRPGDEPEGPEELADGLRPLLHPRVGFPAKPGTGTRRGLDLVVEPGRFLAGPAGVLLTSVLYMKHDSASGTAGEQSGFAIIDAGMNDLLRPALYGAWHPVWPTREDDVDKGEPVDLAGPVCESSDVLARERRLGYLRPGDVLTIGQAGAYGFSMASQYNARPRPAEVLVTGSQARVIRARESYEDLWGE